MATTKISILKLTQLAVLTAVMVVFAVTPLGYLHVGVIEISFMMLPVVIGAILVGPAGGALLGGVFGLTSFIQCFGASTFGEFLLGLNPLFTLLLCFIPRILAGAIAGLVFKVISRADKTKTVSFFVTTTVGALLNTLLFMLSLYVFFWHTTAFTDAMGATLPIDHYAKFAVAFVGFNGLLEAGVCLVVGAGIAKAITHLLPDKKATQA
ncbi:MAG: ECF transporter S component [Oscillospiraceae bacterium]